MRSDLFFCSRSSILHTGALVSSYLSALFQSYNIGPILDIRSCFRYRYTLIVLTLCGSFLRLLRVSSHSIIYLHTGVMYGIEIQIFTRLVSEE